MLQDLEDRDFFYKYDDDKVTDEIIRLFYAYKSSIKLLRDYPDILLIDYTYKTQRYKVPIINIATVSNSGSTISVAVCFIRHKDQEYFDQAARCLRKIILERRIELLSVIITNRKLALTNPLRAIFPKVANLLYLQYIKKNVQLKVSKHFTVQEKDDSLLKVCID